MGRSRNAAVALVDETPMPAQLGRSPARQHLADTIERVRQLEAEVREASAAIDPARDATFAARRVLDDAEDALRGARPRETNHTPAPSYSVWGSQAESDEAARRARIAAEAPPISVEDAKAAVERAKDALDTARRTLEWHEDRSRSASQRLHSTHGSIREAVRLVLREDPATLALAVECRRLRTRAEAARQAFSAILWGDIVQPGSPFYGWDAIADARSSPEAMEDWAASREWSAAIEALQSDPDTLLPMSV